MKNLLIGATAALALLAAPAMAKDTLTIGMVVTLSGPPGALGNQARDHQPERGSVYVCG